MSKRAAIYARVSTDEQADGISIDTQLDAMRRYAAAQAFTVAYEFVEPHTGTTYHRPELDKICELARRGEINALIVFQNDRFTRKVVHGDLLREEMWTAGVDIYYLSFAQTNDNMLRTKEGLERSE